MHAEHFESNMGILHHAPWPPPYVFACLVWRGQLTNSETWTAALRKAPAAEMPSCLSSRSWLVFETCRTADVTGGKAIAPGRNMLLVDHLILRRLRYRIIVLTFMSKWRWRRSTSNSVPDSAFLSFFLLLLSAAFCVLPFLTMTMAIDDWCSLFARISQEKHGKAYKGKAMLETESSSGTVRGVLSALGLGSTSGLPECQGPQNDVPRLDHQKHTSNLYVKPHILWSTKGRKLSHAHVWSFLGILMPSRDQMPQVRLQFDKNAATNSYKMQLQSAQSQPLRTSIIGGAVGPGFSRGITLKLLWKAKSWIMSDRCRVIKHH